MEDAALSDKYLITDPHADFKMSQGTTMNNKNNVLNTDYFSEILNLTLRVSFYPKEADPRKPFSPKLGYGQLPILLLSHHKPS